MCSFKPTIKILRMTQTDVEISPELNSNLCANTLVKVLHPGPNATKSVFVWVPNFHLAHKGIMRMSSNTWAPTLGHTEVCQWIGLVLFPSKSPFLCLSMFYEPQIVLSSDILSPCHCCVFITCSVPVYSFCIHPSKS